MIKKKKITLFLILLLGLSLRLYGINWDQGHYLHPDERMIVMVVQKLDLPKSLTEFFSAQSSLNPEFFAYGSFPLYLLKCVSQIVGLSGLELSHQNLTLIGRFVSAVFDLGIIIILFKLVKKLFKSTDKAKLASLLYATAVFPVQASHFYAVDVILSFFIWLTLWRLVLFYEQPNYLNAIWVGISFGLSLATKVSATALIVAIGLSLIIEFILITWKYWKINKNKWWYKIKQLITKVFKQQTMSKVFRKLVLLGGLIVLISVVTFLIFEPYALIDFSTFWEQIKEQHQMTKDAYVFPYTLQYVETTAYLYPLKQMLFWGLGIFLGGASLLGFGYYFCDLVKRVSIKGDYDREAKEIIVAAFALGYFLVVGRFKVKFMRYMLPLYPFFIFTGANFLYSFAAKTKKIIYLGLSTVFVFGHLLWTMAFMNIYSQLHPRVEASYWINNNIEPGAVLAVEHWDDRLPLINTNQYQFVHMPMYDYDFSTRKWDQVETNLNQAEYMIISSNRLYKPLQKLADCSKYKKCYPKTAQYYQKLFSGELGFKKVAEFMAYPGIKLGQLKIEIKDKTADESFTVYDHPQVMIFKKE